MTFASDVDATPYLAGVRKPGLQALKRVDARRVSAAKPRRLLGSVDVDAALAAADPNGARWDYIVGAKTSSEDFVYWIEIHPAAGDANVGEVRSKVAWLKNWLATTPLRNYPREVVWVASGSSAFTQRDPRLKALAEQGVRFAGGHFRI